MQMTLYLPYVDIEVLHTAKSLDSVIPRSQGFRNFLPPGFLSACVHLQSHSFTSIDKNCPQCDCVLPHLLNWQCSCRIGLGLNPNSAEVRSSPVDCTSGFLLLSGCLNASQCMTGPIPDTFGTANNLQLFDAKQNQLTAWPAAWADPNFNATNSSWINIRASLNQIFVESSHPTRAHNLQSQSIDVSDDFFIVLVHELHSTIIGKGTGQKHGFGLFPDVNSVLTLPWPLLTALTSCINLTLTNQTSHFASSDGFRTMSDACSHLFVCQSFGLRWCRAPSQLA